MLHQFSDLVGRLREGHPWPVDFPKPALRPLAPPCILLFHRCSIFCRRKWKVKSKLLTKSSWKASVLPTRFFFGCLLLSHGCDSSPKQQVRQRHRALMPKPWGSSSLGKTLLRRKGMEVDVQWSFQLLTGKRVKACRNGRLQIQCFRML